MAAMELHRDVAEWLAQLGVAHSTQLQPDPRGGATVRTTLLEDPLGFAAPRPQRAAYCLALRGGVTMTHQAPRVEPIVLEQRPRRRLSTGAFSGKGA